MLSLAACAAPVADSGEPGSERLVDAEAWQLVDDPDDPFGDRTGEGECRGAGYHAEGSVFEVETVDCPYATFVQTAGHAIAAGSVVEVSAWHLDLVAATPATGHLAVRMGGVVGEVRPAIPGDSAAYTLALALDQSVAVGDPIFFHVHNHGSNSWTLGAFRVSPPSEAR